MNRRFNPAALSTSEPEPSGVTATDTAPCAAGNQRLTVGTRVHCILYGGMDGIIYQIRGKQRPETITQLGRGVGVMGGNAQFDIVFTGERAHVSCVPESIVLGSCQWTVEDGVATAEEIQSAFAAAKTKKLAEETEQRQQNQARADQRKALPKQYPWLTTLDARSGKSSHALGAANLKAELNRTFPGVKFSVKSESYSGGDAIRVQWEFGPTTKAVSAIGDKYQQGSFDGMTDCYDYNHDNVWPDVFGGAKYVTESRRFPEPFYEQVGRALCVLQKVEYAGQYTKLFGDADRRDLFQYVNELLDRTDFPPGATFQGVEHWEWENAPDYYWCRLKFNVPSPATPKAIGSGDTPVTLVETKHTKLGSTLFVVQLGRRVERRVYEQLHQMARTHGGYYSSYRRDGAIPGFIFKSREPAEKFMTASRTILGTPEPDGASISGDFATEMPPQVALITSPTIVSTVTTPPQSDWRKHFYRQ